MVKRVILASLAVLAGCASYQIPQKELQRLEKLVQQKEIRKINLEQFFKNHQFPEFKENFFYLLYHLEQQNNDYLVNQKNLVDFFKERKLSSSIPLDDLEKIVHEGYILKIYTGGFSGKIPGTDGYLSLSASEDLSFLAMKNNSSVSLALAKGSLELAPSFLLRFLGYGFRAQVHGIQIYDQGKNMIFQCRSDQEPKNFSVIYHSRDGSYHLHEEDLNITVKKIKKNG